jgi:hypothetical protein
MTLQQIGNTLTGTWTAGNQTYSLTGSINGHHVHLESHQTASSTACQFGPSGMVCQPVYNGECDGVWEFTLTDSTHMVGQLGQTASQVGACGYGSFNFNETAIKQ